MEFFFSAVGKAQKTRQTFYLIIHARQPFTSKHLRRKEKKKKSLKKKEEKKGEERKEEKEKKERK